MKELAPSNISRPFSSASSIASISLDDSFNALTNKTSGVLSSRAVSEASSSNSFTRRRFDDDCKLARPNSLFRKKRYVSRGAESRIEAVKTKESVARLRLWYGKSQNRNMTDSTFFICREVEVRIRSE